jgi:hypothetical protein
MVVARAGRDGPRRQAIFRAGSPKSPVLRALFIAHSDAPIRLSAARVMVWPGARALTRLASAIRFHLAYR